MTIATGSNDQFWVTYDMTCRLASVLTITHRERPTRANVSAPGRLGTPASVRAWKKTPGRVAGPSCPCAFRVPDVETATTYTPRKQRGAATQRRTPNSRRLPD